MNRFTQLRRIMPNADGGETEQEYLERIHAVPGIFSDRNESGATVVTRADTNLAEAEALEARTSLAPTVHPEGQDEEPQNETPEEEPYSTSDGSDDPNRASAEAALHRDEPNGHTFEETEPEEKPVVEPEVRPDETPVESEEPATENDEPSV
jgi:hypothetical protein